METVIIKQKTEDFFSLINPLFDNNNSSFLNSKEIDKEFNNYKIGASVLANVYDFDDEYELELLAPGLEKSDIEIDVDDDDVLTVCVETDLESLKEKGLCRRREFINRGFNRSFQLPENTLSEEITADYKNGIITLFIPKKEILHAQQSINFIID